MKLSQHEQTLIQIAKEFNAQSISWALGGSMLLWYKGIVDQVQDLDIMILEENAEKVTSIFQTFGSILPPDNEANQECSSKVFIEAVINGIAVDIIGGFTIIADGETHYCPLQLDKIEHIHRNDTVIYLDSLEQWRLYYTWMKRDSRVSQITRFLSK